MPSLAISRTPHQIVLDASRCFVLFKQDLSAYTKCENCVTGVCRTGLCVLNLFLLNLLTAMSLVRRVRTKVKDTGT